MFTFIILISSALTCLANERTGIHWGALPIGNYTTDEAMEVGVLARRFDYGDQQAPFDNLLTIQGSYATRGPRGLLLMYEKTGITDSALRLYTEIETFSNRHQRYYGMGDRTSFDQTLDANGYYFYSLDSYSAKASLRKRFSSQLDLEAGIGSTYHHIAPFTPSSQYGFDFGSAARSIYTTKFQIRAIYDGRDSEFIPSRGTYASIQTLAASAVLSNTATWYRSDFDLRYHFPFFDDRWLWFSTQIRYATSSESAPLTEKVRLGSSGTLRGLPLNRFLSNHSITLRGELRTILIRHTLFDMPLKIGAGTFMDSGRIGDTFSRIFVGAPHTAWGFSLFGSYFTDDFLGRADFGFSDEGTAVYIGLGHAF